MSTSTVAATSRKHFIRTTPPSVSSIAHFASGTISMQAVNENSSKRQKSEVAHFYAKKRTQFDPCLETSSQTTCKKASLATHLPMQERSKIEKRQKTTSEVVIHKHFQSAENTSSSHSHSVSSRDCFRSHRSYKIMSSAISTSAAKTNILSLPTSCVRQMFHFLNINEIERCRLVNKIWQECSNHSQVYNWSSAQNNNKTMRLAYPTSKFQFARDWGVNFFEFPYFQYTKSVNFGRPVASELSEVDEDLYDFSSDEDDLPLHFESLKLSQGTPYLGLNTD